MVKEQFTRRAVFGFLPESIFRQHIKLLDKSFHLYLNPHRVQTQPSDSHMSPDRSMIRATPLLEVPDHSRGRCFVQRNMIASDTIDLAPAFAASSLQRVFDVGESLVSLGVDICGYPCGRGRDIGVRVPSAYSYVSQLERGRSKCMRA
jgi:hypothetical protein